MRPGVEQQKIRRHGTGLKAHDPGGAFKGFTLFTPMFGDGTVVLIDMDGRPVHQWKMPEPPGMYGYLTPSGHLIYNGKHHALDGALPLWRHIGKGGVVREVDWEGRLLWELRRADHHHDARKLRNGNVILLCIEKVPREIARRVEGGLPGTEVDGEMYADYVVELTLAGEPVWEWHSYAHLDPAVDRIGSTETRKDWTHGNAVVELANGNIAVSFRNVSTVVVIERAGGRILSKLGPPLLSQQHDPSELPNGALLIFDNGPHRMDDPVPYSRVIEVDPFTGKLLWEYRDPSNINFFSPYDSGAQRLPNGNTFICEGCFGRLFEVTPRGEVVWEYVSPYFGESPHYGEVNYVFRAYRYAAGDVPLP